MSNYEAILLMATVANGVEKADIIDHPDAEIMSAADFLDSIEYLHESETAYCLVFPAGTDGEWEKIDTEYGIN